MNERLLLSGPAARVPVESLAMRAPLAMSFRGPLRVPLTLSMARSTRSIRSLLARTPRQPRRLVAPGIRSLALTE